MNKKLINGLLLFAVATSGVGMFTSCKDNEDATLAKVLEGQKGLGDALQEKDAELARRIKNLEDAGYLTLADREYLLGLIQDDSNKNLDAIRTYVDQVRLRTITSIEIQRVYNPMFGTLNLPFGVNSTVLADYYYEADHAVTFPDFSNTANEYNTANPDVQEVAYYDNLGGEPKSTYSQGANTPVIGNIGKIYVTVNPTNIDATGLPVSLVSSKENKAVTTKLELKYEGSETDEFTFGTRAKENGLYYVEVPATAGDIANIKVSLDESLKDAVKDLYHDQSKSNLAQLAKGVYDQLVNTNIPAYALKIGYVNNPVELSNILITNPGATFDADGKVVRDADGNIIYDAENATFTGGATTTDAANFTYNYLYSKYEIAAVTAHPLSFRTAQGVTISKELPTFGRFETYLNDIFDDIKKKVKLSFGLGGYAEITGIDMKDKITIGEDIEISLDGIPVYADEDWIYEKNADGSLKLDENGNPIPEKLKDGVKPMGYLNGTKLILERNEDGTVKAGDLKPLIDGIESSLAETKVNVDKMVADVNKMIREINEQLAGLDANVNGQIQDILDDIQDDITGKFSKANDLIDLYNKLADRVNGFLKDPNHYLQAYAAYEDAAGDIHHLSANVNDPSMFGDGSAAKIFMTSYNAEILVPSYKKFIAVTNVYKNGQSVATRAMLDKANSGNDWNTVLDGGRHIVALDKANLESGNTYEIFYTALDYRGFTSSRKFYIHVK